MRTVFYAHEVASVRPIVEDRPGHDTTFYNVLEKALQEGLCLEEVFPEVFSNYKHALVKAGRYCDHVFAVGDYVQKELRFLDQHYKTRPIDLVYNGVPAKPLSAAEKLTSKGRMQQYAENLFGNRPDWIFTHVCRPVLSKGIWRDLAVLHQMDSALAECGQTAVYFMLGTLAGQRRIQDIRHMEQLYGWPVTHEHGYPDLCGGEEILGDMFDDFNRNHQAIRAVLVNQWDWNRQLCGRRMPEEMTFADIRAGTDVEFGLSVYEPFGISQFEPLCFGAICVVSNVCGCLGFARKAAAEKGLDDNIIEADFLKIPDGQTIAELLDLPATLRDRIESLEAERLARLVLDRLPRDPQAIAKRIARGYELAQKMSWQHVTKEYFLPSLSRAAAHA